MYFNKEQMCEKFKRYVRLNFDRQGDAAAHYDKWPSVISEIISGSRSPSKEMLTDLGYKKVTKYVKIKHKSCDIE
jgi:hypothetical protein